MKPLYLMFTDDEIVYSNNKDLTDAQSYEFNTEQDLKENFQEFAKYVPDKIDALVLTNTNESLLNKNLITYNEEIIDCRNDLENAFHVPVVNIEDIRKNGLNLAVHNATSYSGWHLDYNHFDYDKRQYGQESMQTIGNGFLGLRGTYLEAKASDDNYPATYVAGVFNQLATPINGREVINEDLVNLPNSQYISFRVDEGDYLRIKDDLIKESVRSLDMKHGILTISNIVELEDGKTLKVVAKKLADLKNYHDYYLQYSVTPLNFYGKITFLTQTDASVVNSNVARYRNLANKHITVDNIENADKEMLMLAHTNQSQINLAIKTNISYPNIENAQYYMENKSEVASQYLEFNVKPNHTYTLEKGVSIYTSLETPTDIMDAALTHQFIPTFAGAQEAAKDAWHDVWKKENIVVSGDITAQKLLRLNSFHMTIAAQEHANKDLDASVGSRGLTGEGYRGHIFWDELFDMNFYLLHYPDLVKDLIMYRYNRLNAAKEYAAVSGYDGAMFPWQSGMYGDEQSQEVHLNPITDTWDPDNSRKQRHVSLAVAYNVLSYYNVTQDEAFMSQYGLEMLFNIAEFWIGKSQLDSESGKYTIADVMGPDEFHENYPDDTDNEGLKNNAYTNIMVSWFFKKLSKLIEDEPAKVIDDNLKRTNFTQQNIKDLNHIRHNLKLDFSGDILGQFEGYFDLKELDFEQYRQQYGNIARMDRILKAHDDSPDNYQVAKQADALMPLFNIRENAFLKIMLDLGYPIVNPNKFIHDNIQYYIARTTHGSTLSRIVYSMLMLKIGEDSKAWKLFYEALTSDYYDIQGGTTAEGIHLGVMGATLTVVTSYFAGVDYRGKMLEVNPHMPEQWDEVDFHMTFRDVNYQFRVTENTFIVTTDKDTEIKFLDKKLPLTANQEIQLTY
ncbi:glycoside hydrolase family 65 protein [Companilactobacillus sp. HBUAS56275]|uniref:Glycoside hydrolase family 65 protein n=1 Tax=Candidatus Companilactobacillus pullicola TaxID=2838523 RepID=A0A9D1ZPP7_9LACO|nr:glycoside hydrolase family 65 protein [Candidatus Companilactobacillus pullicola]